MSKTNPNKIQKITCDESTEISSYAKLISDNFLTKNYVSNYHDNACIYLAYIGEYNNEHKLKWGYTHNFYYDDLYEDRHRYKTFEIIHIWKILSYYQANDQIKILLKNKITPLNIQIKSKTQLVNKMDKQIITLKDKKDLDYCLSVFDKIIQKEIHSSQTEYEKKLLDNSHKYKLLELEYKAALKQIDVLKMHIKDLQAALKFSNKSDSCSDSCESADDL